MAGRALRVTDNVNVPVSVLVSGQPISGVRWPSIQTAPRHPTTWGRLLLASASVGRPIAALVSQYPTTAIPEVLVRVMSLSAGLEYDTGEAVGSDWLRAGADPSEKASVGYRVGMAMAHWVATEYLGLHASHHISLKPRTHWARQASVEADLHGDQAFYGPSEWLLEAKGGLTVSSYRRAHARDQLDAARDEAQQAGTKAPPPHGQALVSAAMNSGLHVVVELGLPPGPTPPALPGRVRGPQTAPTPSETLYQRMLLAAALIEADGGARVSVGGTSLRVIRVTGTGAAVGLFDAAFQETARAVLIARDLASWEITTTPGLSTPRLREPTSWPAQTPPATGKRATSVR